MCDKDTSSGNGDCEMPESNDEGAETSSLYGGAASIGVLGQFVNNINNIIPSDLAQRLKESIDAIYGNFEPIAKVASSFQNTISEVIGPTLEHLSQLYSDINWERIAEGSKGWGEYGWIPPEELSIDQVSNPPATLKEADQIALSALDAKSLELLFSELSSVVPKRKDIEEAISLFKGKRYKATAMLLCSLIECELIKADTRSKRRKSKNVINRLGKELPPKGLVLVTTPALPSAYAYFFHDANDFDRSVEGELNRNFLQHGMMYKQVRKKTCIKLFLILREVVHLTHW